MSETASQLKDALKIMQYDNSECLAALRGEAVPKALGFEIAHLCVIRGILHNPPGFGSALRDITPRFTRALNARSIMSNIIPDMTSNSPEEFPYCIWYPHTADENTYRDLAKRYPKMKYQVARACAVAGYTKLYQELDIIPDVHVAEEARENGQTELFDLIMKSPVLYSVMNDYERTVNESNPPSHCQLNGDTAVRSWILNARRKLQGPSYDDLFSTAEEDLWNDTHRKLYFNITEDQSVDEQDSKELPAPHELVSLLYSPLPRHLPNVNKDLLIFMAAYNGYIDRYARLRRPKMQFDKERNCVVRGIYHNTMFARWWMTQLGLGGVEDTREIMPAVLARFIMINDLSRINDAISDYYLPYNIYYPCLADENTYRELARRRPVMKEQIARACIIGNYQSVFDELDAAPTPFLMQEARNSPHGYYNETRQRKVLSILVTNDMSDGWRNYTYKHILERMPRSLGKEISLRDVDTSWDWIYNGRDANVGSIELFVAVEDHYKKVMGYDIFGRGDAIKSYQMESIPTALAKAKAAVARLRLVEANEDSEQPESETTSAKGGQEEANKP